MDWDRSGAEGGSLAAYGRLLLDGELKVKAHEDQKMRMRYVFVFDKYMLLCKPVKVIYTTVCPHTSYAAWLLEMAGWLACVRGRCVVTSFPSVVVTDT